MDKYKNSKYIFVIGIGGSDLAGKAVWQAMTLHKMEVEKKVLFLESPDEREYEEIKNLTENEIKSAKDMVLITVSKSGKTAETLETFKKTFEILSKKFESNLTDRVLIISSPNTPLWQIAEEKKFEKIEWEGNIGGRFSAFTVAHTVMLDIAGLDTAKFLKGSQYAENSQGKQEKLAKYIFDSYKKGVNILDFFIFNDELEDLGKWCRQLIAESLATITPTVSLGPTDLHSMLELYLGGPKNRFTIFIKSHKEITRNINELAYEDVVSAYKHHDLPFEKYEMPEINEYELGKFMAQMMKMTIELAKLLEVNPYDQPAVDKYKSQISSTK